MRFISSWFYIKYTRYSIHWHPPTTIHRFAQNRPTVINIFLVCPPSILFLLLRPYHLCIINKIAACDPHIVITGIAPIELKLPTLPPFLFLCALHHGLNISLIFISLGHCNYVIMFLFDYDMQTILILALSRNDVSQRSLVLASNNTLLHLEL